MTLTWNEEKDDWDNSIWIADSLYHDEGSHFKFRIVQVIRDNRIEWQDASDSELGIDGETWPTLEQAKAAMQEANNNIASEIG